MRLAALIESEKDVLAAQRLSDDLNAARDRKKVFATVPVCAVLCDSII